MLARLILVGLLLLAAGAAAQPSEERGIGRRQPTRIGGIGAGESVVAGCKEGLDCEPREDEAALADVGKADAAEDDGEDEDEDEEGEDDGTAVDEGRGRKGKKKKRYGKMLLILAGITKAAMLYIMIHAVALLAGKALIVAKVALAIATALALKKSIDHKTSYEIVKHPQYSHSHTHSSSDYDHGGGGGSYEGGSRRKRRARR